MELQELAQNIKHVPASLLEYCRQHPLQATLLVILIAALNSPSLYTKLILKSGYRFTNSDVLRNQIQEAWGEFARTPVTIHSSMRFSDIRLEKTRQSLLGLRNEIWISGEFTYTLEELKKAFIIEDDEEQKLYLEALIKAHLSALSHESLHMLQARIGMIKANTNGLSYQEPLLSPAVVEPKYPLFRWRHYVPYSLSSGYTGKAEMSAVRFQVYKYRQEFATNPEVLSSHDLRALQPYLLYGIFADELNTIFGNKVTRKIISYSTKLGSELRGGDNSAETKKYKSIHFIQALMIHYLWAAQQDSDEGDLVRAKLVNGYQDLGLSEVEIEELTSISETYFDKETPVISVDGVPLSIDLGNNQLNLMY